MEGGGDGGEIEEGEMGYMGWDGRDGGEMEEMGWGGMGWDTVGLGLRSG